ncbi:MAG: glycosyltransferase [Cytophagales bacterium]|nr:glycosyltransferase [Cytophagales bacterium]
MKKVSVIIVNYNVCYFLEQALKSVFEASKNLEVEVFVVDNDSKDNSVELVKEKFPQVKLIANKDNVGFSKANNQAIREATGEYILLLNPDTVIEEDTLEKCCQFMDERPKAGALGVKMVDGQGEFLPESKRGLPTPAVAFYKIVGLCSLFPKSKRFARYYLGHLDNDETNEIEVLAGAYMFMRKSVLDEVGYLDEEYFMYGEDIDLSYRVTLGGYKNYYYPDTRIIHYKGESTKKSSINYVFVFYRAMAIFARKHFSQNQAKLYSFIINFAIYLKASLDLSINYLKKSFMTILDAGLIFGGMYFFQDFWEKSFKLESTEFPPEYVLYAIPLYIVMWLLSNHFSGGNDKPYNIGKMMRGAIIGTIMISAASNFVDGFRYSKAVILFGGVWSSCVFIANRVFNHFFKYGNFNIGELPDKHVVLVGGEKESKRVIELLNNLSLSVNVIGFVDPTGKSNSHPLCLGKMEHLESLLDIYKAQEVIFCSKNMPAYQIIELMVKLKNRMMEYKIVPDDSEYIIGSNSKNRPGDFYTLDIQLNILGKASQRNKRVLDIGLSLTGLLLLPLMIFLVKKPQGYVKNLFNVLIGRLSWVGFATNYKDSSHLPKLRKGVLTPSTNLQNELCDKGTILRLDTLYAKDYSPLRDIGIMWRSLNKLGD